MAKPALTVVTVFGCMHHWNDFMGPLIYLQKRRLWTLSLGIASLKVMDSGLDFTHYMMALSTVAVIPVIIVYFLAQRVFIQGIVLTGMKG